MSNLGQRAELAMTEAVAQLVADGIIQAVKEELQTQWGNVVAELVATRKSHEQLQLKLTKLEQNSHTLTAAIGDLKHHLAEEAKLRGQRAKLLQAALDELGVE